LVFSQWFICYFHGYEGVVSNLILFFNIKFWKVVSVCCSRANMLVASALFRRPLFVQKWPSAMSLGASSRDLSPNVKHVDGGPTVYRKWSFLFSSTYFSLSSGWSACLYLFFFFNYVFLLLLFIIDPFRKVFLCFQFSP
jgi:hypothetical protein